MKIFFSIVIAISTLFNSKIFTQNIYLNYKEKTLEDILINLNKDYNIEVSVSSKLSSKCKITLDQKASSIEQAIEICASYCNLKVMKIGDVYTFKKIKSKASKFLFQGILTEKKNWRTPP